MYIIFHWCEERDWRKNKSYGIISAKSVAYHFVFSSCFINFFFFFKNRFGFQQIMVNTSTWLLHCRCDVMWMTKNMLYFLVVFGPWVLSLKAVLGHGYRMAGVPEQCSVLHSGCVLYTIVYMCIIWMNYMARQQMICEQDILDPTLYYI